MDTVTIIKGTENGTERILQLSPDDAFELWIKHYDTYLKRLYGIFQAACTKNSVKWYKNIDFFTFREYAYENSSKYLSPWV